MKLCIWLLVLILCNKLWGQELNTEFRSSKDTAYISNLIKHAKKIKYRFPDSSLTLSIKAVHFSKYLQSNNYIAQALLNLGSIYFHKGEYLLSKSTFEDARYYCNQAIDKNKDLLLILYNNLGNVYGMQGYFDSAVHYYYLSLSEIEKRNITDSNRILLVISNTGAVFAHLKLYTQALNYLNKALPMAISLNDTSLISQNYANLANVFLNMKNSDSAIHYYNLALILSKAKKDTNSIHSLYCQIGVSYGMIGKMQLAKNYLDSIVLIGNNSYHLARTYMSLGDYYQAYGKYNEAIQYLNDALTIVQNEGIISNNVSIYELMALTYHKAGKSALAYQYQKTYSDLKDSILNEEKIRSINELEVQYRTAQKDKSIAEQQVSLLQKEKSIRNKNLWLTSILTGAVFMSLFFIYTYRTRQKLNKEKVAGMVRQQENEKLYATILAEEQERNRIARDLHDGVGALLSATMMNYTALGRKLTLPLSGTKTYQEGLEMLKEMKQEIRNIAHNLIPGDVAQQALTDTITKLINRLQQHSDNMQIEQQHYGKVVVLQPDRALSLYRTMEELLQNIIKHSEATKVLIQLFYHDDRLNIVVEDNGKGFDTDITYEGIGLKNLKGRIAQLNGNIQIHSQKGKGTIVEIEIPYDNNNKGS